MNAKNEINEYKSNVLFLEQKEKNGGFKEMAENIAQKFGEDCHAQTLGGERYRVDGLQLGDTLSVEIELRTKDALDINDDRLIVWSGSYAKIDVPLYGVVPGFLGDEARVLLMLATGGKLESINTSVFE